MKAIRIGTAAALLLIALAAALPVLRAYDNDPVTDTIRRTRVNLCLQAFNACVNQCNTLASAAPGSLSTCMQDCTSRYTQCTSNIARVDRGKQEPARPLPAPMIPPGVTVQKTPAQQRADRGNHLRSRRTDVKESHDRAADPRPPATPTPRPIRQEIKSAPAFRGLPQEEQREIARNTVKVVRQKPAATGSPSRAPGTTNARSERIPTLPARDNKKKASSAGKAIGNTEEQRR